MSDRRPDPARACAALFDQVELAVALVDRERKIVAANAAFARTFGAPAGRGCFQAFQGRSEPCPSCPVDRLFGGTGGGPMPCAESGIDHRGEAVDYQLQAMPVRGEDGEVDGALLVAADVVHRREQQQTERLASVGLTVASLAHTLKNILTGFEGGIYVVSSGLDRGDVERVTSGWGMVQRYVEQVSTIVRNLLAYSKVQEPRRLAVDPRQLLEGVVRFLGDEAKRAGIGLELSVGDDLGQPLLDPDLIHSCLANLVANAIDACMWDPDLDKVHGITVGARARPEGGVIFEVADNGMGIAEEDQAKLTQTIFTTKGIRGTGLGLLLTRKAVQEHGGALTFESTLGRGTSFRIALPAGETRRAPA